MSAHLEASLTGIHLVPWAASSGDTICGGAAVHVAGLQEHVDHDVVQISIGAADPLGYDEDAQIPKERIQEDHLRDELADDGQLVTEVTLVEEGQYDSNVHLRNTCTSQKGGQHGNSLLTEPA